ncbi:MAG: UDP-N-acetylmuramoyl-L-alanyl-D-glutamate--2,6-diaminopimelate ligase [Gammaproteobacteria bacterium]|nr:UDP-N-acetylmuramoyl-L-alanyl-D-glutamate--2,6-diaminopimelate ligase [Gammaproteobacteria bacterium]MBU0787473.1 UDP-N-acetylmuramoyl-L-alanyl-D-glutamate--2,6-diaminopimelate ligase [Gammaproteobacteria bacterium]MBU0815057.1 UDP-N-acetylmuramoyl-L-alanyl-D-glutamate--2,6-diaminopimelate ligase [Gammaproteobacteria bacterium]MBU1785835.1 UDP-N-acetylmuramoyl-L-alanyl-D-glutamate--2,6-diaminopimelate ligase [Gammaproteobacteria bacterium]
MLDFHTPGQAAEWLRSHVTGSLQTDSRKVQPGDGFIAWPGAATDGRQHVNAALSQGATVCLVEQAGADAFQFSSSQIAVYPQLKAASGPIAAAYYEDPSKQLDVLAVTGTNGKTSTSWWLAQALSSLEASTPIPCGLVGTLGIGRVPVSGTKGHTTAQVVSNGLTTPDPVLLQQTFRRFVDEGLQACAIEASSIGLDERRLDGTCIRTAIFTNFTQDHLDYHGSMEAYWLAKRALFRWPGLAAAVVNVDDPKGAELAAELEDKLADVWTYSTIGPAHLQARDVRYDALGLRFTVQEGEASHVLATQLIGQYNVSNLLAVIGAMRSLGVPLASAVLACHGLSPVPGRMECFTRPGQVLVAVDYAHTPDALGKALQALRLLAEQRGGQLWCVFGCGGNRDASKRPLMGAMAASSADRVVLTSDNPRSEKPEAIISQILRGMTGYAQVMVQADRAQAIAQALREAGPADVILLAGKGHENTQEVDGQKLPFSDGEHVQQALMTLVTMATKEGQS